MIAFQANNADDEAQQLSLEMDCIEAGNESFQAENKKN